MTTENVATVILNETAIRYTTVIPLLSADEGTDADRSIKVTAPATDLVGMAKVFRNLATVLDAGERAVGCTKDRDSVELIKAAIQIEEACHGKWNHQNKEANC